jgi:hypothetical protein
MVHIEPFMKTFVTDGKSIIIIKIKEVKFNLLNIQVAIKVI